MLMKFSSCIVLLQALATLVMLVATPLAYAVSVTIPLLMRADDPRLDSRRLERAYLGQATGSVADGFQLGLDDAGFELEASKLQVKLVVIAVGSLDDAKAAAIKLTQGSAAVIVADLPAPWLIAVSTASNIPVVNVGESADSLRQADCRVNLFHIQLSERMRADAIGQLLLARRWQRVVLLVGPSEQDKERGDVAERAVKRFGLKLVARKDFKLSADPRERQLANVALLTAGLEYDSVWVVDSDGEFARSLPYRLSLPRPVVGDAGLVAVAWHAQFDRYGAPQVSRSFAKRFKRPMTGHDWSGWLAGKAIAQVLLATNYSSGKAKASDVQKALHAADFKLDGGKGKLVSFRQWDRQLRQPLLLTDGQGVIDMVPFDGVMHPTNALDTLGADAAEKLCKATI